MRKMPRFLPFILLAAVSLVSGVILFQENILRHSLQYLLNRGNDAFFSGSVRVQKAGFDPGLRFRIEKLGGKLNTDIGPVPFEIPLLVSEGPVTDLVLPGGLLFRFEGFRLKNAIRPGVSGTLRLTGGPGGGAELRAEVKSIGLEDIDWLNPDNLKDATGEMKGEFIFKILSGKEPSLTLAVRIEEPGGKIRSGVLAPLLSSLPDSLEREYVKELAQDSGLVRYLKAFLKIELPRSDLLKLFLHMSFPDYNLSFNLNLEIQVDEKNAFVKLAGIMGLMKARKV